MSLDTTPGSARVHRIRVRVFYGDTDQMGVAYYANYLRWFEMARNEYLRQTGCTYASLERDGTLLPVVEVACRYLKPARYDDELTLEAWIASRTGVRVRFEYRVRCGDDTPPIATGFTVHACLDRRGRPKRLPQTLVEALELPARPA